MAVFLAGSTGLSSLGLFELFYEDKSNIFSLSLCVCVCTCVPVCLCCCLGSKFPARSSKRISAHRLQKSSNYRAKVLAREQQARELKANRGKTKKGICKYFLTNFCVHVSVTCAVRVGLECVGGGGGKGRRVGKGWHGKDVVLMFLEVKSG